MTRTLCGRLSRAGIRPQSSRNQPLLSHLVSSSSVSLFCLASSAPPLSASSVSPRQLRLNQPLLSHLVSSASISLFCLTSSAPPQSAYLPPAPGGGGGAEAAPAANPIEKKDHRLSKLFFVGGCDVCVHMHATAVISVSTCTPLL